MSWQNEQERPVKVKFYRSRTVTKAAVLMALVLCIALLSTLVVMTGRIRENNEALANQAAALEQQNAALEQQIKDLDTVDGIEKIANEELGLVDPDTVIFTPQS